MATNAGNFVRHKIFRGEPGFIYKKINRFGDLSRNTINYGQGRPRDNKKPTKFEMTLFKGCYPVKFPLQNVAKFQIRQSIFYGEGKIAEWVCDIAYGMTCGMAYMRNVLLVEWLFDIYYTKKRAKKKSRLVKYRGLKSSKTEQHGRWNFKQQR